MFLGKQVFGDFMRGASLGEVFLENHSLADPIYALTLCLERRRETKRMDKFDEERKGNDSFYNNCLSFFG